ncbi:hypothetical protein SGLAD_v1c02890 [Spiroplasma gladiatoris]|uniref:Uncharacterized protein n=1 Tax=Spiroplasma gladiatoris TaxID=2143 RepID=A0A4P7AIC7_9MOLU|nr:hypothetical protein [Spiroplasma gladiatoris]QBQ07488.1 hypothetical protein SGLAD_v1c02890 [Spiroplasma gladiatoris]
MADKITLKDIVEINKILSKKSYTSFKEFETYLDVIGEYIDDTFFKQDIIAEKLIRNQEKSSRFIDLKITKPEIDLSQKNLHDYLSNCKRAIEKALYSDSGTFDLSIFIEIKSTVRYILEKTYKIESLSDYQNLYGINTIEFHQQNETFKYLYSVFDKFTYIARHLNERYLQHNKVDVSEMSLKFFKDFPKDISFLCKNTMAYQNLNDTIELITYSKAWHFVRKLRNTLEHDFADPTEKYNITFLIELLFIIIGRIMLVLNKTIQTESEIRNTLENLEKKERVE